jgi:hypothetical protein
MEIVPITIVYNSRRYVDRRLFDDMIISGNHCRIGRKWVFLGWMG